jgi:hypothetical protein
MHVRHCAVGYSLCCTFKYCSACSTRMHGSWMPTKIQYDLNMTMSRFGIAAASLYTIGVHKVKVGDCAIVSLLKLTRQ